MARTTHFSDRPSRLPDFNCMLVSAFCHLAALVALGLFTASSQEAWRGVKLLVHVEERGESLALDDSPLQEPVELQVAEPIAAVGPVQLFDEIALPTVDFASLDALAENAAQPSGFAGLALGAAGEGEGTTDPAATEFFGIGGYGQTFVYVVDASGSMNEQGKFDRARYELLQSIEQLGSDQRYFILFFNDDAHPMDAREPVPATEEEIARTARWVRFVRADGGTNPLPALLVALSLRPDAIYFLSDGQFDPRTVAHLRLRNRRNHRLRTGPIPIHTIAFADRATQGLMRSIARNSDGEYRFVE